MSRSTFVDECLSGNAFLDEIDNWVARWHTDIEDDSSLDDFLGFTAEEGALWAEQPSALRFIVAAHRVGQPVKILMTSRDDFALAARAEDQTKTEEVLAWLRTTGRL